MQFLDCCQRFRLAISCPLKKIKLLLELKIRHRIVAERAFDWQYNLSAESENRLVTSFRLCNAPLVIGTAKVC